MTTTDAATTSAIALRLELLGISAPAQVKQTEADRLMSPILARQRELSRRLAHRPCAADQRIQTFLDSYLEGAAVTPRLPRSTFVLDQPGLARALSLPVDSTSFTSDYVESYKVLGGVLHNPRNDRRTTAGVFHVAEGGLPIPDDKIAVPRDVFARLLARAVEAPARRVQGRNPRVRQSSTPPAPHFSQTASRARRSAASPAPQALIPPWCPTTSAPREISSGHP